MISKKDWKKHVRQVYVIQRKLDLSGVEYTIKINGLKVYEIDIDNDRIICDRNLTDKTQVVFSHPSSFKNGVGVNKINESLKVEIKASFDQISKLIKGRIA